MTTITTRTFTKASSEVNEEDIDDKNDIDTEESSDDENDDDDDVVDYTSTTIANLPPPAKAILDMIKDCKSLVKYVKKANLNRELQLEREKQNINNSINGEDPPYTTNNSRSPPEAAAAEDQLQYGRKTNCFPRSEFFYKRAIQLLDNMFKLEDDHIRASFLHPNYKQWRGATKTQIKSCHAYCRGLVLPDTTGDDPVISDKDVCEPPSKKSKFMLQLMDKNEIVKEPGMNEIDRYNALTVEEEYTNPLTFWQQQHIQLAYPTLNVNHYCLLDVVNSSPFIRRIFCSIN
ncbi:unnamed protein product [Rotaria socialis]|uniref:Uncharacterized protein n=2 Tax=Rotaria socialis TaxID=392032 RepID=A0A817LVG2_9BILA|nr:unnamed protein product [Rotaria socialis]